MSFLLPKQLLGLLLLVGLSLMSCQNQPKTSTGEVTSIGVQESQKETPNTTIGAADTPEKFLSEDEVVDLVLALPITQKVYSQIKKATQGQGGVSVIVEPQEVVEQGQKYYVVRIGYNGNDRYETYHLLYVNKQDKRDIRIEDPIEGTIIPLAQWKEEN